MTDTVVIPVALGGSGRTYTNDNDLLTGMGLGGHKTRFIALVNEVVSVALTVVNQTSNLASKASLTQLATTNDNLANFSSNVNQLISNLNTLVAGKADGAATTAALNDKASNSTVAGKAAKGVNSDITQLNGLTTPLSVSQGGTGMNTAPAPISMKAAQGRSFGVTYTAATDGFVVASANNGGTVNGGFSITVAGNTMVNSRTTTEGGSGHVTGGCAVAAGQTYSANLSGASAISMFFTPYSA